MGLMKPTMTLLRGGTLRSRKSVQNITLISTRRTPPPKVQNTRRSPLAAYCTCANEHSVQTGCGLRRIAARMLEINLPSDLKNRPTLRNDIGIETSFPD